MAEAFAAPWFWPAMLGVLGLVFGSFIATIAVRWPAQRSVRAGRSTCDACGDTLSGFELVPVLSYAVLLGRCASCRAPVRPIHVTVELLALAVGVAAGIAAPGPGALAGAVFGWVLLSLAAVDYEAFWLPNELTGALALGGLLTGLWLEPDMLSRVIGGAGGWAVLMAVASAYRVLRGRDGLGGGDPKLFGAIGLWLGWQQLPLVLLAACLTGLAVVVLLRLGGRRMGMQDRMPLGVLLAVAAFGVWLATRIWVHA
jgi:leader peptidase (prepilin peptidase)/N-methyltransferase